MNEEQFAASKSIWLDCFPEDDAAFVDWYYRERTAPRYALGVFIEGCRKPVAMLHMLPAEMRFSGENERVCLVAGVCTHPLYRGRGLCSALFGRAFELMRERGFAASVLQPFDTGFYERFGYKTYALRDKYVVSYDRTNTVVRPSEPIETAPDPELLFSVYTDFIEDLSGCTVRSPEYFRGFIGEYSLPGAYLAASPNACCAGYAEGASFTATELFYRRDPADALALLPAGFDKVAFALPCREEVRGRAGELFPSAELTPAEPFCMLAPVLKDLSPDPALCYCLDRY